VRLVGPFCPVFGSNWTQVGPKFLGKVESTSCPLARLGAKPDRLSPLPHDPISLGLMLVEHLP
jgi:hypothetical protein